MQRAKKALYRSQRIRIGEDDQNHHRIPNRLDPLRE
jgi:hypothetical protein